MKKLTLLFIATAFSIIAVSQKSVYLPFFETIGIHEEYQESASKIFNAYLLQQNKYKIFLNEAHISNYSLDYLQQKATEKKCDYFIKGELNALGELILVSVSLYETSSQNLAWSDLLKANTVEDLDPILHRLAKVMGTKEKASLASDIYDVSEYETGELNRFEANSNFGIFIGGTYTFMSNVDNNTSEGFGAILSYDTRDYLLEAKGELFFNDIDHYLFSIDMLVPFFTKRNTPYAGFGIGYGGTSATLKEQNNYNYYSDYNYVTYSNGGLILQAHGGYIFNRNSNVNLRVNVSPFVGLYKVDGKTPAGIKFYVALLFD